MCKKPCVSTCASRTRACQDPVYIRGCVIINVGVFVGMFVGMLVGMFAGMFAGMWEDPV